MSDLTFPSGEWVGFYIFPPSTGRRLMDLVLEFRNGVMSGEGADDVGFFGVNGRYSAQGGECAWLKSYFGRHSVDYSGFREKKGIWGTWVIDLPGYPVVSGGFHIWPIGAGGFVERRREEAKDKVPLLTGLGERSAPWRARRMAADRPSF